MLLYAVMYEETVRVFGTLESFARPALLPMLVGMHYFSDPAAAVVSAAVVGLTYVSLHRRRECANA